MGLSASGPYLFAVSDPQAMEILHTDDALDFEGVYFIGNTL